MKGRYATVDLKAAVAEIQASLAIGLRVVNVYDIDNKTYLIRLATGDVKHVILVESGNRMHLTDYDWPKNLMPSGFAMKCRKHLKGRRLVSVKQLGIDRIIDLTFGYDEATYHFIVELYDRGNIILTDYQYIILQLLRVRTDTEQDVKFAVRERYPVEMARQAESVYTREMLEEKLRTAMEGEQLKRYLSSLFVYGPALVEHCLLDAGLKPNSKLGSQFRTDSPEDMDKLMIAVQTAEHMFKSIDSGLHKGYILQKNEQKIETDGPEGFHSSALLVNIEFHPFLYKQHEVQPHLEFPSFNKAVDEFFSKLESQKIDVKALQQEKSALKKLENIRRDHEQRLQSLKDVQDEDSRKAELVELNLPLVERAINTINSAIAHQIDWEEIEEIVKEAQLQGDPVAGAIKALKLDSNQIILSLRDPFEDESEELGDEQVKDVRSKRDRKVNFKPVSIEIDLSLTAFANARLHHDKRRQAAVKEQKTVDASKKALKSAERKTKEMLKEVQTTKVINKTRKTYWFEKFYWFISSENFLVIGGRDQQQNELVVKRYLRPGDLYIHADLHGASSVVVKNPAGGQVPPKTLNEAGTMAVCYSAAWDAKIVTSAWWVHHDQVSKTAPSGEYLTTGSFMIRGKKNYLPPCYLIMGFGVLFKLDEQSVPNHKNERRVRAADEDTESSVTDATEDLVELHLDEECEDQHSGSSGDDEKLTTEAKELDLDLETKEADWHSEANAGSIECDENPDLNEVDVAGGVGLSSIGEHIQLEPVVLGNGRAEEMEVESFPDTSIQLQHVGGDKFQLHRGISTGISTRCDADDDAIYLGDGEKIELNKGTSREDRKPKLSAKQRRDLKKKSKPLDSPSEEIITPVPVQASKPKAPIQLPPKDGKEHKPEALSRGQRRKQKKIHDKYGDQDEEDRELMVQILQASNPGKPAKGKSKEKREKKAQRQEKQEQHLKKQHRQKHRKDDEEEQQGQLQVPVANDGDEVTVVLAAPDGRAVAGDKLPEADDDDDPVEDRDKDQASVIDSLTGCPISEDLLLFAIPVCAPYGCMQNYKCKVKVTPGTGKRGKATRTAMHVFQSLKEISERERDLLRSFKDVDISRNLPGKVKVSAPNLQKTKKK